MKKLFKRFAPLLLALVMVLGSCLTVSAAESDTDILQQFISYAKSKDYEIYKYQAFIQDSGHGIEFICSDAPLVYDRHPSASNEQAIFTSDKSNAYTLRYASGSISVYNASKNYASHILLGSSYNLSATGNYFNHTVKNYSDSSLSLSYDSTGFFPTPPPLVAAVEGADLTAVQREIILLIPLSILYLVGYRGLQKGLQILSTLLRRA